MITVHTKLIALLGNPVEHSVSPKMQNYVYEKIGYDACYFPVECDQEHLGDIINAVRYMNFAGLGLTTPNKEAAMQYMDEIDELAAKMGAINTVVKNGTHLKGYNTDGEGAVKSLKDEGVDIGNSTYFVWGAGGAGKSVCYTLVYRGAKHIYICDIPEKCEQMAAELNEKFPGTSAVAVHLGDDRNIREGIEKADVLLNLSGLGMSGKETLTPVDASLIQSRHICFDATYKPERTRFLREAEAKGCRVINGLGMVVNQGALQVQLWAGCEPPYEEMRKGALGL